MQRRQQLKRRQQKQPRSSESRQSIGSQVSGITNFSSMTRVSKISISTSTIYRIHGNKTLAAKSTKEAQELRSIPRVLKKVIAMYGALKQKIVTFQHGSEEYASTAKKMLFLQNKARNLKKKYKALKGKEMVKIEEVNNSVRSRASKSSKIRDRGTGRIPGKKGPVKKTPRKLRQPTSLSAGGAR